MRFAAALVLMISILPACKGKKGDPGPAGKSQQSDITIFQGTISSNPQSFSVGALDSKAVLVFWALSSLPNDWLQLGNPTGDNSVTNSAWYSVNSQTGVVTIRNAQNGDRYKILVVTINGSSSLSEISDRFLER